MIFKASKSSLKLMERKYKGNPLQSSAFKKRKTESYLSWLGTWDSFSDFHFKCFNYLINSNLKEKSTELEESAGHFLLPLESKVLLGKVSLVPFSPLGVKVLRYCCTFILVF